MSTCWSDKPDYVERLEAENTKLREQCNRFEEMLEEATKEGDGLRAALEFTDRLNELCAEQLAEIASLQAALDSARKEAKFIADDIDAALANARKALTNE